MNHTNESAEKLRLLESHPNSPVFPWYKWGPYLAERSWGTVREDYSVNGDAWNYFPYEISKYKAYKWGEDGIAGICDRFQILALSFAFWNGRDKEIKERLFGVIPQQGNHGEDVKEYYYYLDNTPSHSYMKYLYKYTQNSFPYETLALESNKRGKDQRELELFDTGAFHEEKYFDIFIEYAKSSPEDIAIKVTVHNRFKEDAEITLLPQLVFRNIEDQSSKSPIISYEKKEQTHLLVCDDFNENRLGKVPFNYSLGKIYFYASLEGEPIFTNNETNEKRLSGKENKTFHVKDGFNAYIVHQQNDAISPEQKGTKGGVVYKKNLLKGGEKKIYYFRLASHELEHPLEEVEWIIKKRKQEADEFYQSIHPKNIDDDEKNIQRQALASLLWSKQFYYFDVNKWLKEESVDPRIGSHREEIRNKHWKHLLSMRILLMPDKWEYPWFAAWDLAFHAVALSLIDIGFAKEQLWLLLFDQFQHPNGQIPAYEWEFSEMNPPVHAWAVLRVYQQEFKKTGRKDLSFLKKCFNKLIINFTWWVNKVDLKGNNVFEGGFLGLDNITVIDRSMPIPGGGTLQQSDGTGWMGMFCLILMRISLELALEDSVYEMTATKFFEHYVYIASALHAKKERGVPIWNEQEGFFYDVLALPNGESSQILVRSLVGIIPLYGIEFITQKELDILPNFKESFLWFFKNRNDLASSCMTKLQQEEGESYLLSLMNLNQMKKVLAKVWDPNEFRSEYGLRSLSKIHEKQPYSLFGNTISYEPGESVSFLKGGNSNWRGPIWFPTTFLLIDSLKTLHEALGDDFYIEFDYQKVTANDIARYFAKSLIKLFKKDATQRRPIFDSYELMQSHPNWRDYLLFYEHFHADTGRGLGASHQTGWTALVANLIDEWSE